MKLKSTYIFNKKIYVLFFLFYLFGLVFVFRNVYLNQREVAGIIKQEYLGILIQDLFVFVFQLFVGHLFIAMTISFLVHLFKIRRPIWFVALIVLYALVYLLQTNPQVFDDILGLTPYVIKFVELTPKLVVDVLAGLILTVLFVKIIFERNESVFKNFVKLAIVVSMVYYFFWIQRFDQIDRKTNQIASENPALKTSELKNKILIGIDSLRPKINLADIDVANASLKFFLNESLEYTKVISPIARTHAAFTSILSGKDPYETGLRDNLGHVEINLSEVLRTGNIGLLKKQGYRVVLMLDDNRFVQFDESDVLDEVWTPTNGYLNYIQPSYFRNTLIFAFFNNKLGHVLFPILKNNQSFSFAYKLRYFTGDVIDKLESLRLENKPFVFVAHTCALHSPGSFYYPFYKGQAPMQNSIDGLNYGDFIFGTRSFYPNRKILPVEFNQQIYKNGIDQIVSDYLNPIFNYVFSSTLTNNSEVILFSDHGEFFGQPIGHTNLRYPTHGDSTLFLDDSFRAYLRQWPNRLAENKFGEPISLKSILNLDPKLLSKNSDLVVYSENGIVNTYGIRGSILNVPELGFKKYKIDSGTKNIYFDDYGNKLGILAKHRSVFAGNLKLSIFLSEYGLRYAFSDLDDPEKTVIPNKKMADFLFAKIKSSTQMDANRFLFPEFITPQKLVNGSFLSLAKKHFYEESNVLNEKEQYLIYARILELKHRLLQTDLSTRLLKKTLLLENLDNELRAKLEQLKNIEASGKNSIEKGSFFSNDLEFEANKLRKMPKAIIGLELEKFDEMINTKIRIYKNFGLMGEVEFFLDIKNSLNDLRLNHVPGCVDKFMMDFSRLESPELNYIAEMDPTQVLKKKLVDLQQLKILTTDEEFDKFRINFADMYKRACPVKKAVQSLQM